MFSDSYLPRISRLFSGHSMPRSSHPHVYDQPKRFGECTTYEVPRYVVLSGFLLRLPQVTRHRSQSAFYT
jgi:hypothetical protein